MGIIRYNIYCWLTYYSGIAQLVEHLTVNQVVVSSSLTAGVTDKWEVIADCGGFLFLFCFNFCWSVKTRDIIKKMNNFSSLSRLSSHQKLIF